MMGVGQAPHRSESPRETSRAHLCCAGDPQPPSIWRQNHGLLPARSASPGATGDARPHYGPAWAAFLMPGDPTLSLLGYIFRGVREGLSANAIQRVAIEAGV